MNSESRPPVAGATLKMLLTDTERSALSPLSPDWAAMPRGFTPNATAQRLEALGLIECRVGSAGWLMRITRKGFEARGSLWQ